MLNQLSKEQPTDAKLPESLKPHYPRAPLPPCDRGTAGGSGSSSAKPKAAAKARGKAAAASSSGHDEAKQMRSSRAHDFIQQQFGGALRNQVGIEFRLNRFASAGCVC